MASLDESPVPLLVSEQNYEFKYCLHCGQSAPKASFIRRSIKFAIFRRFFYGIVVIFTFGAVFLSGRKLGLSAMSPQSARVSSIWSPVADSVQYEVQDTPPDYWTSGKYMGPPSREVEQAWNKLMFPTPGHVHGFRLLRDEAKQLELNESALLKDGNFAVILTIHHNLHCLRRIRQTFYRDHYYPGWQENGLEEEIQEHSLHCLEAIRQSMICQPELTVMPYRWKSEPEPELMANPVAKRECVDWELLNNAMIPRKYRVEDLVGI